MIAGLIGKMRSGKNQLAEFVREEFERKHNRIFYEAGFAIELKNMCKFQFGLSNDQLWGDKKEWADERFPRDKWKHLDGGTMTHWTPREIMQEMGVFYRKIDSDFWVKGLRKFLQNELLKGYKDFIITDVRYINEAEFIKSENGFLICVQRDLDNRDPDREMHGIVHESETNLDGYKDFDMYIDNNGDLADLKIASYNIVNAILSMEKLIKNRRII
jgi:hypothetical protein